MPLADVPNNRLTVGIIGGLGPQATADLFRKIIDATPVDREQDHLHILIDNEPDVADRQIALGARGPSPGPKLAQVALGLQRAGADFLVLASNTPHAFADDIRRAVSIPFLDMVELTCEWLSQTHPSIRVAGIIATAGCLEAGLYQRNLHARGIQYLEPRREEIPALMEAIHRVKLGRAGKQDRDFVRALALRLEAAGADAIISGCTELPLLISQGDVNATLVDSSAVLARTVVEVALRMRPPSAVSGGSRGEICDYRLPR